MNNQELKKEIEKLNIKAIDLNLLNNSNVDFMILNAELKGRIEREKEIIEEDLDFLSDIINFEEIQDLKEYLRDRITLRRIQLKSLEKTP
jgi:hypothetical protein